MEEKQKNYSIAEYVSLPSGGKIYDKPVNPEIKLRAMTGRDEIVDIPVYVCTKCGKIPQDYMDKANAARILGESTGDSSTGTKAETKSSSLIL